MEKKLNEFPCDECPVLAMCKNKTIINCSLLYNYLHGISGYKGMQKCLKKVTKYFNRQCIFLGHSEVWSHARRGAEPVSSIHLKFINSPMVMVFRKD